MGSDESLATSIRELRATAEKLAVERSEIQQEAKALAKWQGEVTTTQVQHEKHLGEINGVMTDVADKLETIRTVQAVQRWQIGLAAAFGSAAVTFILNGGLPGL